MIYEESSLIRTYDLEYFISNSQSLLASVSLSAGNSSLNKTLFSWNTQESDGITETAIDETTKNDWGVFNTSHKQIAVPNIDNDGKTDIVNYWTENSGVKIELRSSMKKSVLYTNFCSNPQDYDVTVEPADFNGDGMSDIVVRTVYRGKVSDNSKKAFILLSPSYNELKTITLPNEISTYNFGDYNNDGKDDMISLFQANGTSLLYYHLIFWSADADKLVTDFTSQNTGYKYNFSRFHFGDFFGDGSHQILALGATNSSIFYLQDYMYSLHFESIDLNITDATNILTVGDFNGDGKSDIITVNKGDLNTTYKIGVFNGSSFAFTLYNSPVNPYVFKGDKNSCPNPYVRGTDNEAFFNYVWKRVLDRKPCINEVLPDGWFCEDCDKKNVIHGHEV